MIGDPASTSVSERYQSDATEPTYVSSGHKARTQPDPRHRSHIAQAQTHMRLSRVTLLSRVILPKLHQESHTQRPSVRQTAPTLPAQRPSLHLRTHTFLSLPLSQSRINLIRTNPTHTSLTTACGPVMITVAAAEAMVEVVATRSNG